MMPRIPDRPSKSRAAYAAPVVVLALLLNVTAEQPRRATPVPSPTLGDLQKQAGKVQRKLGEDRPGGILRQIGPLLRHGGHR